MTLLLICLLMALGLWQVAQGLLMILYSLWRLMVHTVFGIGPHMDDDSGYDYVPRRKK